MSIYSNPILTVDIPWKIFVRGNNEVEPENPAKKFVNKLNFSGSEALEAYEEVILNEQSEKSSESCNSKKIQEDKKSTVSNATSKSSCKTQTKNVTVNSIMKAVEQRDLTFLRDHIHPENVNTTDSFGWTPLMLAAYCGFVEVVDFLLKSGANKRFREKSGLTAAQLALKKNYLDVVALLRKNAPAAFDSSMNIEDLNISKGISNKEEIKQDVPEEVAEFYCDVCKSKFKSRRHENSILHIFNSKSKLPSAFFGISKANKGYQMLLSTGWDGESGLGKESKGQKYPVKTVLKIDRKGLGMSTKVESRITHFKPGDPNAVKTVKPKTYQTKVGTKKDREKLLSREARKERALRIALS